MNKEAAFWMTLAHELPAWNFSNQNGWKNEDKMNLIIQFYHDKKMSIDEFFGLSEEIWKNDFAMDDKRIADLRQAKQSLASHAFLAENLYNSGVEIVPVISPEYSKTLKENLKKSSPVVMYIKGNRQILNEKSIAIVGSRNASDIALQFTDNIARSASKEYKVVVSGFAKGVDKQALDSSIAVKGHSIIVLPQGIMTFESGFKTYYRQIIDGDVLVTSVFHPKAGWSKDLAMARNSIIYGLANEIYVAESKSSTNRQGKETKGGTWAGAIDGLRKGRTVYVRQPEASEQNDNHLLIRKGAVAVDLDGNVPTNTESPTNAGISFESKIREILSQGGLSAKDILSKLQQDMTSAKLNAELKKLDFVELTKDKRKNVYKLKGVETPSLFDKHE
jgi:predicted Rossmann fold nucleotide-binding protein DprA/Smf involved in DNA uptake